MFHCTLGSDTYFLVYDAENRLVRIDGDRLFSDGFEGGGLSAWSSAQTGGGDLSVSGQAAE